MIILQAIKVLKVVSQRALVFGTEVAIPAFGSAPTATLRLFVASRAEAKL